MIFLDTNKKNVAFHLILLEEKGEKNELHRFPVICNWKKFAVEESW